MITAKEKNIIKKAWNGVDYEKIILFGSRIRGNNRVDSDFDLMVVFKNDLTREEKKRLSNSINKKLVLEGLDCDVLIRSESQINYYKNKNQSVTWEATREGQII